ncbi:MAG: hypothetical protein CSA36_03460 [Draconibacterium sp.]|nr:MAG: hypothetical protein CSA36_03460 [Draconibacterium sp.]
MLVNPKEKNFNALPGNKTDRSPIIATFMPDSLEIGPDITNPLQPLSTGIETKSLKKEFGSQVIFLGRICIQYLLPNQSVTTVNKEVLRKISIFGGNGSYIIAPEQNIQDNTSEKNIIAFLKSEKSVIL